MATITISSDDGTQLYQIGFADPDWANMTAQMIVDYAGTVSNGDGTFRDPTADEAMSFKCDAFFNGLVTETGVAQAVAAVAAAQATVSPINATAVALAPTLANNTSSISIAVVAQPPVKLPPV